MQLQPLVWFLLVDSVNGKPYKNTPVSSILRSSILVPVVDQLRDAIKAKQSNKLAFTDSSDLIVYKNKAAFDADELPLRGDLPLVDLGASMDDPLIVAVPSPERDQDSIPYDIF
jgi:hypothetical protein